MIPIDINTLTSEQQAALLAELSEKKKAELQAKSEEWKKTADGFVTDWFSQMRAISDWMCDLKPEIIEGLMTLKEMGSEHFDAKSQKEGWFRVESICGKYRVEYEETDKTELDERSAFAREHLDEFFKNNTESLAEGLINNKKGNRKISVLNAKKLIELEDRYTDPNWQKATALLKESLSATGKHRYVRAFSKGDDDKWTELNMRWSSM